MKTLYYALVAFSILYGLKFFSYSFSYIFLELLYQIYVLW